ncbi:Flavin-dependent oxidoreductase, luciferase family (includes alkanesulfonate monooxygenase SsuD and methylene tetrahydromethanopterin reductase) [Gracilibacillus ureilyticus]|uniref:Flavin-dependent oxidoreductase, luciferase family (Includes alkanesulfonate monooxygenase SsuD and methylene tetrahydromethanopterin reductase) n=1 Tax=Gracilibacillus ureilyticus TaxID=531814 RepID=A0A1H9P6V3_9BACI|nr:LLM class flavin-dependent oxidoreductase [Gracilibacillus ureilyticus]SER43313.1 Flavin-dependent oxidoreductase, luciferase family (includes alkanesulfonate monooxygenase SsuD and methylene tetrahydromethanopterin reductase) [Gracilibacillus ureilyticus]
MKNLEFGIYTLSELMEDPIGKKTVSPGERLDQIVEMAAYADKLGLDLFGVGEHHRLDYAVSSPQVVLSAIAQKTENIRLTALTSLLNTSDPVRLFEDFSTLDLLSKGRIEFTAGRGAFVESFPLFGYNEHYYDELFEEHLQLFIQLNHSETVSWNGTFRPGLENAEIAPRPFQKKLPVSIGVGGTIESAIRAGKYNCDLTVVMIGGVAKKYQSLVQAYKNSYTGSQPFIAISGHAFIRETEKELEEEFYQYYSNYWKHLTRQGIGGSMGAARSDLEYLTSKESTLFVGTPKQIIEKIMYQYELFGHHRFNGQVDFGGQSAESVKKTIELLATKVKPQINK